MPQLDTLTYFSQFFWFIILFLTLYIILSDKTIPTIAKILKTRNKMIKQSISSVNLNKDKINIEHMVLNALTSNKK